MEGFKDCLLIEFASNMEPTDIRRAIAGDSVVSTVVSFIPSQSVWEDEPDYVLVATNTGGLYIALIIINVKSTPLELRIVAASHANSAKL